MDNQIMTQNAYNKIKDELNFLSSNKRREIAERIERAKELGDLSENAEYSEAKDAQALNEGRILELMNILKNVTIVEEGSKKSGEVGMGSIVRVSAAGKEKEFSIVSFNEADPLEGKISNESPLGMSFLDKKKGDKVIVKTPKADVEYEILDVK